MSSILVVDDQRRTLGSMKRLFERRGQRVLGANDASEASSIFSKDVSTIYAIVIDLRLTDATVGDLGGFELACRFRQFNKYIPIFIYSASEIDDSVKSDSRINKTYRKGGKRSEGIDVDEILTVAQTYWDDFHRDDPHELLSLKDELKIDEDSFLRLIEPKTPLRHERIIDLLLETKAELDLSQNKAEIGGWRFSGLDQETVSLSDSEGVEKKLSARVSYYEKSGNEHKAMFTSLPMVFAYGPTPGEALQNLQTVSQEVFLELTANDRRAEEGKIAADGVDFLRLTSFFKRAH